MPAVTNPSAPVGLGQLVTALHEFNTGKSAEEAQMFLRDFITSWGGLNPEKETMIMNGLPGWARELITRTNWFGLK